MQTRYEEMIQQGRLPNLTFLRRDDILQHEYVEPNRVKNIKSRIMAEGLLKNPIMCCKIPEDGRYCILDGAHRYSSLSEIGCTYIPVQIIDYTDSLVELKKWRHLFYLENEGIIYKTLESFPKIEYSVIPHNGKVEFFKHSPRFYCQIILSLAESILVTGSRNLTNKLSLINKLVNLYKETGIIDRISYNDFEILTRYYKNFTGLIVFPKFTKQDIISIALNGVKLPTGITRHLIPKRALHMNIPLNILMSRMPAEEIQSYLYEYIDRKTQNNSIRFYSESTFFFDD